MHLLFVLTIFAADAEIPKGSFSGKITDAASGKPLPGVNVILAGTEYGAATDELGYYIIKDVPVAEYSVEASMIGYKPQVVTRVQTLPSRTVFLDFRLRQEPLAMPGVTVRPDYFAKDESVNSGDNAINYHEIRLNPEGYNVARTVAALPGVATGFDFSSDIIVRGGDPDENLTVIDNLPVPYPVHFPAIGGGFGQASIVSVEGVEEVEFSPGGYGARNGEKISSLMNITLRDGNKERFEALVDLNMSAVEAMVEGPLGRKFNYIAGYRRSFLELVDLISNIGNVTPSFDDFYLRCAYSPNPGNKIWLFGIQTLDRMSVPGGSNGATEDMKWNGYQTISGLNWRALLGEVGYSVLTFGGTNLVNDLISQDTALDSLAFQFRPHELHLYLREALSMSPFKGHELQTGVFTGFTDADYAYYSRDYANGGEVRDTTEGSWLNAGAYLQYSFSPWQWLKLMPGVRVSYNTLTDEILAEPRAGLSLKPFAKTAVNMSFGVYHQLNDYRVHINNEGLSSKRAWHAIAGVEQLIRDDLKLSLEYYYKHLDNLLYYDTVDSQYTNLEYGKAQGVELFVQKKMGRHFYGQAAYSLCFSERTNPSDGTYAADWDTRHIVTLITGVKFLKNFEASVKYRFSSGRPYTPFDTANAYFNPLDSLWYADRVAERNSDRLPFYSRLDFQLSHTSYTRSGIAITGFVNLQNVLNQSNVVDYQWDSKEGKVVPWEQFRFMPVGGVTVKF